jgi:hypothetical protein
VKVFALVLGVDQQAVCPGVEPQIEWRIADVVRMTRGLYDKRDMLLPSCDARSISDKGGRLPYMVNDVEPAERRERSLPALHLIQPNSQSSQGWAVDALRKQPLRGAPYRRQPQWPDEDAVHSGQRSRFIEEQVIAENRDAGNSPGDDGYVVSAGLQVPAKLFGVGLQASCAGFKHVDAQPDPQTLPIQRCHFID